MRILHVFDHSIPLHSGYTFRSRSILRAQRARGWQTVHVTSNKHASIVPEESIEEFHFYRTFKGPFLSKLPVLNQWDVVRQLKKRLREIVRKELPDVVHAHSPCLNGLAAAAVAKQYNIPFVYEVRAFWEDAAVDHGTTVENSVRYQLTRALETHVFNQADQITCICEGLKQDIIHRGIASNKVTVIPNAVDVEKFDIITQRDSAIEQKLGLQGATVIGFIGSFYAYEGLDVLLNAVATLRDALPHLRVLLVGGGPQEAKLRQLTQRLCLDDVVLFTGRVPHGDVNAYYSLIDVLAYPRHKMRLTDLVTPLKPLEAMAQKKLVLASDVGGHRELIRHGNNGFLFTADDVSSLARAITEVIAQKGCWPEILHNGREYVIKERNWTTSVARYQHVYAAALDVGLV